MIRITDLNKKYKSKRRKECHALNNINLTLPDTGLVFVLGKSGSGKSTLLNLIGGLDSITSGTIEVDGNDISGFKEREFCNYRNTHIGFVFQDYHLIDELTVYENIALALNLRHADDPDKVKAALEKVELAGYEERYPTELSGGERQRVAIARAIVKDPRIILADEPTGNLDTRTATSIVELLKNLSKDCLILIVSHNVNDASSYADRIIELSGGEVISDKIRNPKFSDEMTVEGDELVYPQGLALSDDDIKFINNNLNKPFVKKNDKFLPTKLDKSEAKRVKIDSKSLSLGKGLGFSVKFLKNKAVAISLSSFIIAVIMIIMSLAQTIIVFDSGEVISGEMNKNDQSSIVLNKVADKSVASLLDKTYPEKIGEDDMQAFYDAGYKGEIYPVYNHSLIIDGYGTNLGCNTNTFSNTIYMNESFGTIIVDEEFLTEKFGELELVASAEHQAPYGIYITDYLADCALTLNKKYSKGYDYEDLVGEYYAIGFTSPVAYVNGIIKTDYKERFDKFFEEIKAGNKSPSDVYNDPTCQKLLSDVYDRLGYCYSTNPDFVEALERSPLSFSAPHYKMNVNGVINYTRSTTPYVSEIFYTTDLSSVANYLTNGWYYSTDIPDIPEGAKYIRVAFNDNLDTLYNLKHPIAKMEHALLAFDYGEPISKEIMNYNASKGGYAVHLNAYNGQIEYNVTGVGCTYVSDYIEIPEGAEITSFVSIALLNNDYANSYCVFYDENKEFVSSEVLWQGVELSEKTVYMNYQVYNEIFGTSYDPSNINTFSPRKITLSQYEYSDIGNQNQLFEVEVTVRGLHSSSMSMFVSEDVMELFKKDAIRSYSLYFNGTDGIGAVLDNAEPNNYELQSYAVEGIHIMTEVVDVFIPIFELISIFLYVGIVVILIIFSTKLINDKMHEIGILKAIGAKNYSIGIIFGIQVILIALLTCIISALGYLFFIDLANDVLIASIRTMAPGWVMPDLQFLIFEPSIVLTNCILTFILAVVSLIIPMIKIRAIKPVKIIKVKE